MKPLPADLEAIIKTLQQDLATIRRERGISQSELAHISGVSQPFISKLESGYLRNVEIKTLVRLVAALGAIIEFKIIPRRASGSVLARINKEKREDVSQHIPLPLADSDIEDIELETLLKLVNTLKPKRKS